MKFICNLIETAEYLSLYKEQFIYNSLVLWYRTLFPLYFIWFLRTTCSRGLLENFYTIEAKWKRGNPIGFQGRWVELSPLQTELLLKLPRAVTVQHHNRRDSLKLLETLVRETILFSWLVAKPVASWTVPGLLMSFVGFRFCQSLSLNIIWGHNCIAKGWGIFVWT